MKERRSDLGDYFTFTPKLYISKNTSSIRIAFPELSTVLKILPSEGVISHKIWLNSNLEIVASYWNMDRSLIDLTTLSELSIFGVTVRSMLDLINLNSDLPDNYKFLI